MASKIAQLVAKIAQDSFQEPPTRPPKLQKTTKTVKQKTSKNKNVFLMVLGGLGGPSGAIWRPCWAMLAHLGDKMGHLGAMLRHLGDKMRPKSAKMNQDGAQERQEEPT